MNALQPLLDKRGLSADTFSKPAWDKHAGLEGAFTALSKDGQTEAIAEPVTLRDGKLVGWRFWLMNAVNGETLWMEDLCAN